MKCSFHKIVKRMLEVLQHLLQDFDSLHDNFLVTRCYRVNDQITAENLTNFCRVDSNLFIDNQVNKSINELNRIENNSRDTK